MPIIKEKAVSNEVVSGLRDPLVSREVDPAQQLVECVNCATVYFRSSYDSLVQSNRGQCLNCKGDKYYALTLSAGTRRGDRWGSQGGGPDKTSAKPKREMNFIVPSAYNGPLLPAPSTGERWTSLVGEKTAKEVSKLKLGEGGREWSAPFTMGWTSESELVFGKNKAIHSLSLDTNKTERRYFIPWYRDKDIHDFSCVASTGEVAIVGRTFRKTIKSYTKDRAWSSGDYLAHNDNPDFNRVSIAPSNRCWVHFTRSRLSFLAGSSGRKDREFEDVGDIRSDHRSYVSWSASERYVSLSSRGLISDNLVKIFDLEGGGKTQDEDRYFEISGDRYSGGVTWHPKHDVFAVSYHGKDGNDWIPPFGFAIVDAQTKQVVLDQVIDRNHFTTCSDWSPDGRFIALGGYDQAVFLWDFEAEEAFPLLGHRGMVTAVAFSPDGQRLVSASEDGKVIIWGCGHPRPKLAEFEGNIDHDRFLRFKGSPWSPSGRRLAISSRGIQVMELE